MANKYLIHGATYCGDGTTSAEAASAGAAGAWNNINVFEGTAPAYGSLAAGDTVYIRSKTGAGADADVVITAGASKTLGSSAATTSAWVTWVIDGGMIWSGVNGKVQYDFPSTYTCTLRSYNYYRAEVEDKFVIRESNSSSDYKKICTFPSYCRTDNLFVDCSSNGHSTGNYMTFGEFENIHKNLHLKWAKHYAAPIGLNQWSNVLLINPSIELTVSDTQAAVFAQGDYGSAITVIGGRLFGTGATTGNSVTAVNSVGRGGKMKFVGFEIPKTMTMVKATIPTSGPWQVDCVGLDAYAGGYLCEAWGEMSSREDKYYPTRTAFLPDSTETPWSWWVYPSNAGLQNQMRVPLGTLYIDTDAAKTLTAYLLLADTVTTANKGTMWIEVIYTDASTGLPVSASSRDFANSALDSSTVTWSARTYGETGLSKKQIAVTTPTSIKQDSLVHVVLCGTWKSASANDFFVLCPDIGLS